MAEHQGRSGDSSALRPVAFQFKVTWSALYAKLPETSRCRALVKTESAPLRRYPAVKQAACWSMVVPKMQRPQRARVLEIPAPREEPRVSKVVESQELFAFFAPAAALAACLVLLLFQFLPVNRMTVVHPSAMLRAIYGSNQPDLAPDVAAAEPPRELAVTTRPKDAALREVESAPSIPESVRAAEIPAPPAISPAPAPPASLSETGVYRPPQYPEPILTQGFESSRVLKKVKPIYPELATAQRIQGTVRLKATINKEGAVEKVVPESGPAMLFEAASNAVRQWTFLPARLNGDPVEDVIHINIGFAILSPGQEAQR
ncbi:MAG TPA: energy transducer TonB [Bryobacteraceae bacterium]|nr:energy transducer TonB [Bryobacteraceae bacterium]